MRFSGLLLSFCLIFTCHLTAQAGDDASDYSLKIAGELVQLSQSLAEADNYQSQMCALVLRHMDIDYIGKFLLGRNRREASVASVEAFKTALPQLLVSSFKFMTMVTFDSVKIKRTALTEDSTQVTVIFSDNRGIPYYVDFHISPTLRILDLEIQGFNLITTKRSDIDHQLKRLARKGSTDPIGDLAAQIAQENPPCP